MKSRLILLASMLLACWIQTAPMSVAQTASAASSDPVFLSIRMTDGDAALSVFPSGLCRIETSTNLRDWTGLVTLRGNATVTHTDSAASLLPQRFYRYKSVDAADALTGDHLQTSDGEITFHPINHATFVMAWNGRTIYLDPVGGATRFQGLRRPDLILLTHSHSDHFDTATLNAVKGSNTVILAPPTVFDALPGTLKPLSAAIANGAVTNLLGMEIEAVPAYNDRHPKGAGNGYVLTIGGKRIYISGDTGDTPEVRALPIIDVAFLCMNLPFTLPVDTAAEIVRSFRPKVIYPYHYSDSDLNRFKRLVGTDLPIEVRLRDWY
ncbi:MAG: MBL fold metallo-hydrolase [Verrucomicrobiia bacterium]